MSVSVNLCCHGNSFQSFVYSLSASKCNFEASTLPHRNARTQERRSSKITWMQHQSQSISKKETLHWYPSLIILHCKAFLKPIESHTTFQLITKSLLCSFFRHFGGRLTPLWSQILAWKNTLDRIFEKRRENDEFVRPEAVLCCTTQRFSHWQNVGLRVFFPQSFVLQYINSVWPFVLPWVCFVKWLVMCQCQLNRSNSFHSYNQEKK